MQWRNSNSEWGLVSMTLHWLVVLLVFVAALLGLVMDEMPNSVAKLRVYALHKSFGMTVLGLMLFRLLWRFTGPRPQALDGIAPWQARIADLTHWLLYAVLLAMPLSGWLYNSASNFALQWFGLFNLPAISPRNGDIKDFAEDAHELLFWVIVVLVVLHAGAAFWHHLVRRDRTLDRMLPAALRRPLPGAGSSSSARPSKGRPSKGRESST